MRNLRNEELNRANEGKGIAGGFLECREILVAVGRRITAHMMHREQGIDGILVTVGLCIIALLLCVVMKDSLSDFIEAIVTALQTRANGILTGV